MKLPGKIAADVPDGGRSKEQSNECQANLKRGNPLRQIYLGPITDQPISIVRENAIYLPRHGRKASTPAANSEIRMVLRWAKTADRTSPDPPRFLGCPSSWPTIKHPPIR